MWGGYIGFFLFCFVLFAYWSFPYGRLRDWLVHQVEYERISEDRKRPTGWELEIVDLSPSWFTGAEMSGVRLAKLPENPGEHPLDITFETIRARVSLLGLLIGSTDVTFYTKVGNGDIEGEIEHSEDKTRIDADVQGVRLRRLQLLRGLVGLPIAGQTDGSIDLTVAKKIAQTEGGLDLSVKGLTIGDGNSKLKIGDMEDGITVDEMRAGDLSARLDVNKGVARVEELRARGEDVRVSGAGKIRLLKPLRMSRADILVRVKFTDAYRNKSDRTRALFSLMEFNRRLRAARTDDGALQWRINGSFGAHITTSAAGQAQPPGGG